MQHFYEDVPGWFDFENLYREAVAQMPEGATMVEVGVYEGRSLFFLAVEVLRSGKSIEVIGIDRFNWPAGVFDRVSALRLKHGLETVIMLLKDATPRAAHRFPNASLDFVFIDADHDFEAVKADIEAWWPKIRPGGILAGHDFGTEFPGVRLAVEGAFSEDMIRVVPPKSWWVQKPLTSV